MSSQGCVPKRLSSSRPPSVRRTSGTAMVYPNCQAKPKAVHTVLFRSFGIRIKFGKVGSGENSEKCDSELTMQQKSPQVYAEWAKESRGVVFKYSLISGNLRFSIKMLDGNTFHRDTTAVQYRGRGLHWTFANGVKRPDPKWGLDCIPCPYRPARARILAEQRRARKDIRAGPFFFLTLTRVLGTVPGRLEQRRASGTKIPPTRRGILSLSASRAGCVFRWAEFKGPLPTGCNRLLFFDARRRRWSGAFPSCLVLVNPWETTTRHE